MNHSVEGIYQGVFQPQVLVSSLGHDLERPFLHYGEDRVLTAGGFRDLISQVQQALGSLGLGHGARIGILSANKPEVLGVTGASLLNEYVLVPMHPLGSLDDHLYVVNDSGMEALIIDPDSYAKRGAEIAARLPALTLLTLGPAGFGRDLCHIAAAFVPQPLVAPVSTPETPYRLSYSGGTTGKPKAVIGTHRTGLAVLDIQMKEWEWPGEVRQLMCAHLSHAGSAMFLPTLLRGGCIVVLPGFDALKVLQAIEKHRITCVLLVPTMIYALLDHPRFAEFDLSSLETIFYGASAMNPTRLREGIEKIGPVFFQFYGQVEAPMTISVLRRGEHLADDPARLGSCGRAVPWVHVALMDDRMREVPDGTPGEICVRGPLVMAGYHGKPEQTAEALAGGWLHTGDVAVKDAAGFMRIVDRKKDMIVSGGFNVYPRELEDVIGTHPAVSACSVIGVPDDYWGEAVTAVVVLRPGCEPCGEAIKALVKEKKGAVQAPKTVIFLDALPLTSVGKPDKKALRARYAQPQQGAAGGR